MTRLRFRGYWVNMRTLWMHTGALHSELVIEYSSCNLSWNKFFAKIRIWFWSDLFRIYGIYRIYGIKGVLNFAKLQKLEYSAFSRSYILRWSQILRFKPLNVLFWPQNVCFWPQNERYWPQNERFWPQNKCFWPQNVTSVLRLISLYFHKMYAKFSQK